MARSAAVPSITQRSAVTAQMLDLICFLDAIVSVIIGPRFQLLGRVCGAAPRQGQGAQVGRRASPKTGGTGRGLMLGKGSWNPGLLVPKLQAAAAAVGGRAWGSLSASPTPPPWELGLACWELSSSSAKGGEGGFQTPPSPSPPPPGTP